jgi:hypothetical protein
MLWLGKKFCKEGHAMDSSWDVCPVCIAPIRGWFVWTEEADVKQVFNVHEGRMLIGSGADCEIRIKAPGIKRHHAHILSSADKVEIVKVTPNGEMTVNHHEVNSASIIDGDLIQLGEQEFKFKCL